MEMRTIVFAATIAVAAGGFAAPEKALDIQLADKDRLVASATKLGERVGELSMGTAVEMLLSQAPAGMADLFGASRMALYADDDTPSIAMAEARREDAPPLRPGEVMRVTVAKRGAALLARAMDEIAKSDPSRKAEADWLASQLKDLGSAVFTVSVGDSGLDVGGTLRFAEGSAGSKMGGATLSSAEPLAFAGADALFAAACGTGGGVDGLTELWGKAAAALSKRGVKTSVVKPEVRDADGGVRETAAAVCIEGVTTGCTASWRLVRTMPEAAARKRSFVGVFTLYGALKGAAARVAALPSCEAGMTLSGLLAGMPAADNACIAAMGWKEADGFHFLVRLNPDEIRGLLACASMITVVDDGEPEVLEECDGVEEL